MASRAILRRRRTSFIHQYFYTSSSSISSFNSPLRVIGAYGISPYKHEFFNSSPGLEQHDVRRFASFRDGFSGSNASIGVRWLSQSTSAATAKNDEPENDDGIAKKRKEASPEECDQAVEGLTTAKAKAMAKRSQESQKDVQSILQRVWATFLGIGPALKAIASMSRSVSHFPSCKFLT